MQESFKPDPRFGGKSPDPRLVTALGRLDLLVDWERRSRSPGAGRRMRQSTAPARRLLDRLGAPDRALECVLVAGTKGKGTVASLVARALGAAGEVVGLYTSPHVERIEERVRIAGRLVEGAVLASALEAALDANDECGGEEEPATWFDVLTAAAILAFARAGARQAVLECGLGGRLDSTNAVEPVLSVVTNIALEHTGVLGRTHAAIAREKAAIARRGRALVSAVRRPPSAVAAVRATAVEAGARLVEVAVPARATLAEENLAVAACVLEQLGKSVPVDADAWAAEARLPGRSELVEMRGIPVLFDGAHVPASLSRVLTEAFGDARLAGRGLPVVVLGAGEDKDLAGILKALLGRVDRVLCTSLGRGPYATPDRLLALARAHGVPAEAVLDPAEALDMAFQQASTRWVLVTGSLHLVGRLRPSSPVAGAAS